MTAKMVIASAERLIDVRHFWRKRKRIAEISVPACPIPTQNTKFVMSHAQPTGTLRPQMPIPSQKSHETATPRRPRQRERRDEEEPPADRCPPLDRLRDDLGDRVEVRRPQDECGTAHDRVVEQLCFRLGQAGSPLRVLKVAVCTIAHRWESSVETGVAP